MDLRAATPADAEAIVALQCDRNGAECDAPVRRLLARPDVGPARFAVAATGDTVASSLCLIPERLRIGSVEVDAGQVEYVATAKEHERRGLVRSLLDLAHGWSAEDGQLVQLIAGIPYFYRRFGYEYALPFHRVWLLEGPPPERPPGWIVRPAVADDAGPVVALQHAALEGMPLAVVPRGSQRWRERLVGDIDRRWFVAETAGVVRAVGCIGSAPPAFPGRTMVGAAAFADGSEADAALDAFLATAAVERLPLAVQQRGTVDHLLAGRAELHPRQYALYLRVPDVGALLERLRPVLTDRLQASEHASFTGELLVSFYRDGVRLHLEAGTVTGVEAVAGEQAPTSVGGIGVPPDLVATLVFGKFGAAGLADRHEDVQLGERADLAETLFPRLDRDITLL